MEIPLPEFGGMRRGGEWVGDGGGMGGKREDGRDERAETGCGGEGVKRKRNKGWGSEVPE